MGAPHGGCTAVLFWRWRADERRGRREEYLEDRWRWYSRDSEKRLLIVATARAPTESTQSWVWPKLAMRSRRSFTVIFVDRRALFRHRTLSTSVAAAYCSVCWHSWLISVRLSMCLSACLCLSVGLPVRMQVCCVNRFAISVFAARPPTSDVCSLKRTALRRSFC